MLFAALSYLFAIPRMKKQYKQSQYYQEFHLPFRYGTVNSPAFRFFESFKERRLDVNYIRQESNGLEYFLFDETLFLFPDFEQIAFNEEKSLWEVDYDGDWEDFDTAYSKLLSKLEGDTAGVPIKLFVERRMFPEVDLSGLMIPECVFLTRNYETAFENEQSIPLQKVPTNNRELYELMLATPNLCGDFEIAQDGNLHWDLYDNVRLEIGVDPRDCYIGVVKKSGLGTSLTHWHPTIYEVFDDVCKLGLPGNVLVVHTFWLSDGVRYMGDEAHCPYSADKKLLLGKRYYLKPRKHEGG